MPAAYPTTAEVTTFLEGQALSAPSNIATILAAVITDFERKTGYQPFYVSSAAADTTWTFDPPYRERGFVLDLEGAFMEITSVTRDGVALTVDEDYVMLPLNAAVEDPAMGWNKIRFVDHPGWDENSIVIVGRRGRCEEVPDDVYEAIMNETAARAIPAQTRGPGMKKRTKQGQRETEYDNEAGRSKIDRWHEQFKGTITAHQRMVV